MKARIENGVVYSPFPSVDIPLCSAYTVIKDALSKAPERVALVEGSVRTTRGDLLALMESYAAGFQQRGVGPGDRVCTHLKNSVENLAAMYGCIFAGAALVLAKTSLTESELRGHIIESDSTHILTDVELTSKVKKATSTLELKQLPPWWLKRILLHHHGNDRPQYYGAKVEPNCTGPDARLGSWLSIIRCLGGGDGGFQFRIIASLTSLKLSVRQPSGSRETLITVMEGGPSYGVKIAFVVQTQEQRAAEANAGVKRQGHPDAALGNKKEAEA
ncbi:uncharacterized protein LOC142570574 [Dermacentor variabilis]|uniref:uncharacterized protein LOC142570574 n=1 Tax=Dermacentor variabilis TaxID=34621 RepID=UPI003F5B0160